MWPFSTLFMASFRQFILFLDQINTHQIKMKNRTLQLYSHQCVMAEAETCLCGQGNNKKKIWDITRECGFSSLYAFFTVNECVFLYIICCYYLIIMHVFKLCRLILHHHHHLHHTLHCSSWNNPAIGKISCFKVKSRETDEQGVCVCVCVCVSVSQEVINISLINISIQLKMFICVP